MQFIFLAIVVFLIWKWFSNASGGTIFGVILVFVLLIGAAASLSMHKNRQTNERKERQRGLVRKISEEYQQVLAKKRAQLLVKDDYGDTDHDRWLAEIQRFHNNKIRSELEKDWEFESEPESEIERLMALNINGKEIAEIVDEVAKTFQDSNSVLFQFDDAMNGIEYEHYCADLLRRSGWDAKVSKASNDQGVDILASKGNLSIAIQCKKYSSPVGNKAVQEVISGSIFYQADRAVVVTNNTYTPSARQLASNSGVLLMHHTDLVRLGELSGAGSNTPEKRPAAALGTAHKGNRKPPDEPEPPSPRDLSSDAYKIWLADHYSIKKNIALNKFICNEKLFDTIEGALLYADSEEKLELQSAESYKELMQVAAREHEAKYEAKRAAERERFKKAWGPSIWFFSLFGLFVFAIWLARAV